MTRTLLTLVLICLSMLAPASALSQPATTPLSTAVTAWQAAMQQPHAPGELLVQFRNDGAEAAGAASRAAGVASRAAGAASRAAGAAARITALATATLIEVMPALGLHRYQVEGDLATALALLDADPAVAFAEPNYFIWPDFDPNDPLYQAYAVNDTVAGGGYLKRMHLPQAWDLTYGHPSIVVAIIDSGIEITHEDLQGAIWQNPGEIAGNGLDDDHNDLIDDTHGWNFAAESADVGDVLGHGSHVAGIVGARFHNGMGIAGVAPKTTLMPVVIFPPAGYGTFADEIEAILYAVDEGAQVINLSLGSSAYSRGEQMAVEYAVRHGVLVVASAGNNGRTINNWPAAHEAAIAVAAVTATDTRSSFSNLGAFVDLAAAGSQIWSLQRGSGYRTSSGTSMAAPHVSGLAALILARNPTLTPAEVRAILQNTAVDLGTPGWDAAFGHGRVDALAALQATPPYTGSMPTHTPDWLATQIWPPLCVDIVQGGGFEEAAEGHWLLTDTAALTTTVVSAGARSLYLGGDVGQTGSAIQTLTIPPDAHAATLAFAIRTDNQDRDLGADPINPGRDHLYAWFRATDQSPLLELLRAGNDTVNLAGPLPWDRYLHVLSGDELALLRAQGQVQIFFQAQIGTDTLPTRFFIDDVRLCVSHAPVYLPLWLR